MSDRRRHTRRVERYLYQRDSRYLVRVAVPKDLRGRISREMVATVLGTSRRNGERAAGGSLTHVEKYLGTDNPAEARRRMHAALAKILNLFKRVQEGRPLTRKEIDAEAAGELRETYDFLTRDPIDGPDAIDAYLFHIVDSDRESLDYDVLRPRALKIIAGIGAEPSDESIKAMCDALADAAFTARAMFQKNIVPPSLPNRSRPRLTGTAPRFFETAELFLAERQSDPRASMTLQTAAQHRATFRLFRDFTNDATLDSITRADAADFLSTVARLHPHYGRRPGAASLTLNELLEHFPAGGGNGLSNRTLNRHQSALKTFFKWARATGRVDFGENPFAELARPKARHSVISWLPFDTEELNKLLAGETFATKPKQHTLATARPWVMAVALFSGLRQGEICSLDAEDVREENGVTFFDVTEAKSEAGVRRVPVHSRLVELGFLRYVAAIKSGPLFPGIAPGGPDGKRSHTLAKRFPAFRRARGVDRERVAFHSFRKNFVRALELAKIDRDRAALVIGHERGFTFRVYNPEGVDLVMLRDVVEAARYQGLKL